MYTVSNALCIHCQRSRKHNVPSKWPLFNVRDPHSAKLLTIISNFVVQSCSLYKTIRRPLQSVERARFTETTHPTSNRLTNLPTNHPTTQPTNQPTSQPTNQPNNFRMASLLSRLRTCLPSHPSRLRTCLPSRPGRLRPQNVRFLLGAAKSMKRCAKVR